MRIKLIKGWMGRSPGTILEPQMNEVATRLIARGFAEEVIESPSEPDSKPKPKVKLQEWVKKPNANTD